MKYRVWQIAVAGFIGVVAFVSSTVADDCSKTGFLARINQYWCETNSAALRQTIHDRNVNCTNDLLSVGLNYACYYWVDGGFTNTRIAAIQFLAAVSNIAPQEISNPCALMDCVKTMAGMTPPAQFPTNEVRTSEQVIYLHSVEFPSGFPELDLYLELVDRVETNR